MFEKSNVHYGCSTYLLAPVCPNAIRFLDRIGHPKIVMFLCVFALRSVCGAYQFARWDQCNGSES